MIAESLILAAGFSSRCNTNKLLLPIESKTVIEQCILSFYPTCRRIIVVSGFYHDDIKTVLQKYAKVEIIYNQDFQKGMFNSIKRGVMAVSAERFFITPGDYPFIKLETIAQMLRVESDLVKPICNGATGHPILLSSRLIPRLLKWRDTSLRDCIAEVEGINTEVCDRGILTDIDTMEDYFRNMKE